MDRFCKQIKTVLFTVVFAIIPIVPTKAKVIAEPPMEPAYYGPNALLVPDMIDGTADKCIKVEAGYDYIAGYAGDVTHNINLYTDIPLYTDRVHLRLFVPPVTEFWHHSNNSLAHYNLTEDSRQGNVGGDIYVATDIHVLKEEYHRINVVATAMIKSASGDDSGHLRYFDVPAYHFYGTISKTLHFDNRIISGLNAAAMIGFSCWQIDKHRQNDAVLYGLQLSAHGDHYNLSVNARGIHGRLHTGDAPAVIKTRLDLKFSNWSPYVAYQHGLNDYPFNFYSVGLLYSIPLIK